MQTIHRRRHRSYASPPPPTGDGDPITQIINQIIEFPFQSNAAERRMLILTGTVTPLDIFRRQSLVG
jgi:hypothetical protein